MKSYQVTLGAIIFGTMLGLTAMAEPIAVTAAATTGVGWPFIALGVVFIGLPLSLLAFWVVSLRVVVPTNYAHIVQLGKNTVVYGKGQEAGNAYYAWPAWIPKLGIDVTVFKESIFTVELMSYDAYEKARLPFEVDVAAFFRVKDASLVAQRAESFEDLVDQLTNVLQGAVRRILATNKLEEIMEERSKFGEEFTTEVECEISQWGVIPVKSIEFMDIRDAQGSNVISNIMAKEKSRIDKESRVEVAQNNKDAEEKEIEAQRAIDVRAQLAEQAVGEQTAEKVKMVGIADERALQDIKEQARVTAEKDMRIQSVEENRRADINKEVAITKAGEAKEVAVLTAAGLKEAAQLDADAELYTESKNAEGIKVVGEAKGAAEQAILMAPVNSQITLATEIGDNQGYQEYLTTIRGIESQQEVGVEMARSLSKADIKVISNGGTISEGMSGIGDILSAKGGLNLGSMLESFGNTEKGAAILNNLTDNTNKG
jgi:flotillin